MKSRRILSTALFILGLITAQAATAQTQAGGAISSVTVFPDRAFVTRSVQVPLSEGLNVIEVGGLPVQLNDASLQVAGSGTAGVVLLDATVRTVFLDVSASAEARALREKIDAIAEEMRLKDDRLALLNTQWTFIGKVTPPSLTPVSGQGGVAAVKAEDLSAFVAFFDRELSRILPEIAGLQREKAALQAKREALEQELGKLSAGQTRQTKTALVRLQAANAGATKLDLSYQVPGASWAPVYQVRASADSRELELVYDAQVVQNTGETWDGVKLTLSTARPSLGGSAPEVQPWILDVYQPQPMVASAPMPRRASGRMLEMKADSFAAGAAMENEEIAFADAAVADGLTAAAFSIAAPAVVPADGSPQKVSITRLKLQGDFEHRVTPRLQQTTFLHATTTNTSDFPLLPGSLAIFLDGNYVAEAPFKRVMPGEKLELALGPDEGVKIERKLLNRFSEVVGLTQSTTRISYDFATTVTNNRKANVKLVLSDVVPVSRNEKVTVSVKTPADKDKSVVRGQEGRLTWTLDLKPAEKRVVPLQFSIEHPKDLPVGGIE